MTNHCYTRRRKAEKFNQKKLGIREQIKILKEKKAKLMLLLEEEKRVCETVDQQNKEIHRENYQLQVFLHAYLSRKKI